MEPRERRRRRPGDESIISAAPRVVFAVEEESEHKEHDTSVKKVLFRFVCSLWNNNNHRGLLAGVFQRVSTFSGGQWCRCAGVLPLVRAFDDSQRVGSRKASQRTYVRRRKLRLVLLILVVVASCALLFLVLETTTLYRRVVVRLSAPRGPYAAGDGNTTPVRAIQRLLLPIGGRRRFPLPPPLERRTTTVPTVVDHGGLELNRLLCNTTTNDTNTNTNASDPDCFRRAIDPLDGVRLERDRALLLTESSTSTGSTDRVPYVYWHAAEVEDLHLSCRRPNWTERSHPTCNGFHEIDRSRDYNDDNDDDDDDSSSNSTTTTDSDRFVQDYDNYYITHGFYRDVWVNRRPPDPAPTILKTTRMALDVDDRALFGTRQEAVVMERLSAYRPIVNLYSYCGTSVVTEAVPHEVEAYVIPGSGYRQELVRQQHGDDRLSENDFTPTEKLQMALAMAESIAILHGFEDGLIVHDDIQLQQWLRASTGELKLGDFNRASIPDWDEKNQDYCKYSNGAVFGNVRATLLR
jgi:hypothetical protein